MAVTVIIRHARHNSLWRQKRAAPDPCDTGAMSRPQVQLLTRAGCTICDRVHAQLQDLAAELDFDLSTTDVDAAAEAGDSSLRAEFGDRLPVILLDGGEHSYWEVDEARLRKDLGKPR
jgi:glutaredoxin